ncbi:hypothetical protein GXW78_16985 [Roseomonas terrae]|uniref:Uncharacterized protein n=1 Tax=Neoroseomonas terrae TaxID=424799 RepID=A0ABS5EK15_9PROT|nr:hypothetical protein [Neoroseomonas terrae]MBR0651371.1 hypothetical protein [Neoroseomonas terrae]
MLSNQLDSYAGHFNDWAKQGGIQMDARLCSVLTSNFREMADQARRLEGQPVPDAQRPLPPGVVRLADFRPTVAVGGDGGRAA